MRFWFSFTDSDVNGRVFSWFSHLPAAVDHTKGTDLQTTLQVALLCLGYRPSTLQVALLYLG